jgi:hypothetical protein
LRQNGQPATRNSRAPCAAAPPTAV